MTAMRFALALGLFAVTAGSVVAQTTWHVDVNGAPPGDGSTGNPYTSIQFAIDQPSTDHGDTLLVAPGTYVEEVDYKTKRVRIVSVAGPEETVIKPLDPAADWVVLMNGLGYVQYEAELEGFSVVRDGTPQPGQSGVEGWHNSFQRIKRCIVTGHGDGLLMGWTGEIDGCTVSQCINGVRDGTLSKIFMKNTIVKENIFGDVTMGAFGHLEIFISYSNFDPSTVHVNIFGSGNINQDPQFWDSADGDYRLRPDSPCIDTGDPASPTDPDGSRVDMGAFAYDPLHAPGTEADCFGSNATCPCGNGGSGLGGCDIAQGTGGVAIGIRDFNPDGAGGGTATIFGTDYPAMSLPGVTLIRSPAAEDPPVVFGDGLRCIANSGLVRIRATLAMGGTAELPVMHGAGAGTFYYQLWNRNTPIMFCDPAAAFNLSNALSINWP
jgi:hypothetical protein